MSSNSTSKYSQQIFTSYFWPALMAFCMALILSQWAVADPQATPDDQATTMQEEVAPPADEPSMDLPPADESKTDSEGTPDAEQLQATPTLDITSMAGTKLSEKCYEQTDGSFECVCEGEEECKTLETAEHCEPGTHWGKDGYGGCTKKVDK